MIGSLLKIVRNRVINIKVPCHVFLVIGMQTMRPKGRKNVCDFGVIEDVKVAFCSRAYDWIAFLAGEGDIKIF